MTIEQLARLDYVLDFSRPCLETIVEQIGIDCDDDDAIMINAIMHYVETGFLIGGDNDVKNQNPATKKSK